MTDLPCKDCKFCSRSWFPSFWNPYEFALCKSPRNFKPNPVSGHLMYERTFCDISRKYDHCCGPEAKDFEPRRSKSAKYHDLMEKKKKTDEAMKQMWDDLKKANAKVWENIGLYTLPNKPGHFDLNFLKQQYLSGSISEIEKELNRQEIALRKEITTQVKIDVKKDAATLIRKKYKGQKLIMENPEKLAKLIEDMK